MGKRIIAQRRGKGSNIYKVPVGRAYTKVRYPVLEKDTVLKGTIIDLIHDSSRNAPIAKVLFENGTKKDFIASETVKTEDSFEIGTNASLGIGNILPVSKIPEGTPVFNLEIIPNDGGKLMRGSGTFGIIVSHDVGKTVIKLPSKIFKSVNPTCRATIGIAAGGERKNKPFVKAGNKFHAMKARGRLYPITSKIKMNAVDHKFGGSNLGVAKTTSRHAPPGRKVGSFGAKRTGKKR
ncbi:MAG: 50S ribosomal protein L2 [Candidatus Aenigmarchaeota archaeon]|nr:50S ribosomal protein L2 [Candidatus Aenigmarchaeota archaeon]